MSAEPHPNDRADSPRPILGWSLLALSTAWLVAVPLGLGPALVGPDSDPAHHASRIALLYLPGLVLLSLGSLLLASPLFRAMPRWRPGCPVYGLPRASEPLPLATAQPTNPAPTAPTGPTAPTPAPSAPNLRTSPTSATSPASTPAPPLIALGPGRSPAYAAFGFAWTSPIPGARPGFVALPPASRLVLGRDPRCDLVVGLAEASWHHLELEVTEAGVRVTDLGSKNGTRLQTPLAPHTPTPLAVGDTLHLAEPVALSLTLEALR